MRPHILFELPPWADLNADGASSVLAGAAAVDVVRGYVADLLPGWAVFAGVTEAWGGEPYIDVHAYGPVGASDVAELAEGIRVSGWAWAVDEVAPGAEERCERCAKWDAAREEWRFMEAA